MSPPHARGRLEREPGERVIRDQKGRSMSNNDEYVGRFSEGEEVLGTDDPDKHHAVQRSRVFEAS
jgi:hypothetical protein